MRVDMDLIMKYVGSSQAGRLIPGSAAGRCGAKLWDSFDDRESRTTQQVNISQQWVLKMEINQTYFELNI